MRQPSLPRRVLGGRFGYFFLIFSARGEGGSRGAGGRWGIVFFYLEAQEGGLEDERGRGAGRVSAANWGIGGGLNFFFSGPKCPPRVPRTVLERLLGKGS